jgi:hypothetical protein
VGTPGLFPLAGGLEARLFSRHRVENDGRRRKMSRNQSGFPRTANCRDSGASCLGEKESASRRDAENRVPCSHSLRFFASASSPPPPRLRLLASASSPPPPRLRLLASASSPPGEIPIWGFSGGRARRSIAVHSLEQSDFVRIRIIGTGFAGDRGIPV